jgi:alkylation response protein AidB-like acyl-CoA dehydrogenase
LEAGIVGFDNEVRALCGMLDEYEINQADDLPPEVWVHRELPCLALTSPYAGSDPAAIPDRGVLIERDIDGRKQ